VIELDLPPVKTASDVCRAQAAILQAVGMGHLTLEEAASISGLLDATRKAIELNDIEQRLAQLEQRTRSNEH
jgi:hypothetical protein